MVAAQTQIAAETYDKAVIVEILEDGVKTAGDISLPYQLLKVRLLTGPDQNKIITIDHGSDFTINPEQKVKVGNTVVLAKTSTEGQESYRIFDVYRTNTLLLLTICFFLLILVINRLRGLGSLLGLFFSLLVITLFIVPQIIAGRDPLLISITGSLIIMTTTLYLAHGFGSKTTLAILATFISLLLTGILAIVSVKISSLSGLGNDETASLRFGPTANMNFQGFLLGGIIIGALGVLDDITTTQVAAVGELWETNKKLSMGELFGKGFNIGREHISSLVNTLILAYAGASLPLFIFLAINPSGYPLWVMLNSEFLAEEIIRSLVGSIGLILSVPIATLLAAWYFSRKKV